MVRSSSVPIAGNRRRQHRENSMTTSRVQLALNVTDIDAATSFYRDLFGVEPAKQRPGYANFEVADPPLKLVLFHSPQSCRRRPFRNRRCHRHLLRLLPVLFLRRQFSQLRRRLQHRALQPTRLRAPRRVSRLPRLSPPSTRRLPHGHRFRRAHPRMTSSSSAPRFNNTERHTNASTRDRHKPSGPA